MSCILKKQLLECNNLVSNSLEFLFELIYLAFVFYIWDEGHQWQLSNCQTRQWVAYSKRWAIEDLLQINDAAIAICRDLIRPPAGPFYSIIDASIVNLVNWGIWGTAGASLARAVSIMGLISNDNLCYQSWRLQKKISVWHWPSSSFIGLWSCIWTL